MRSLNSPFSAGTIERHGREFEWGATESAGTQVHGEQALSVQPQDETLEGHVARERAKHVPLGIELCLGEQGR